ncbi:unnamed protein product [Trichobilharzia regenti]|nr:unnamed protein product [Trichobilharzia regenti]
MKVKEVSKIDELRKVIIDGCIIPEDRVVTDTQLPEESMIANLAMMEDHLVQNGINRSTRYHDDVRPTNPPNFLKPLAPQIGLQESAPAHFETIVEPSNDPSLIVEWYKDGKPVSMGKDCQVIFAF